MLLPGRLRSTSLGDLLGTLHRGQATGTLELVEDRGRVHRIHMAGGLVVSVELDAATPTLAEVLRGEPAADEDVLRRSLLRALASQKLHGEVLIGEFHVSPAVVGRALRRQLAARLEALEELADARVCFRVAVRPPRGALQGRPSDASDAQWIRPLEPRDFLHGRRRARERSAQPQARAVHSTAWQALGLSPGADTPEIKRAYKRLARAVHPDLHPEATDGERRVLAARFNAITEAYRVLT
jgi:DnaJ domain